MASPSHQNDSKSPDRKRARREFEVRMRANSDRDALVRSAEKFFCRSFQSLADAEAALHALFVSQPLEIAPVAREWFQCLARIELQAGFDRALANAMSRVQAERQDRVLAEAEEKILARAAESLKAQLKAQIQAWSQTGDPCEAVRVGPDTAAQATEVPAATQNVED